jgi:hypothetical protein
MHNPTFEAICTAVEEQTGYPPKGSDTRKKGVCPAHEDTKPSLSIRWDAEKLVVGVTCWSGCTFDEIVKSLDLTKEDFRDKLPGARSGRRGASRTKRAPKATEADDEQTSGKRGAPEPGRNEVARYPYTDETGKVLYYNVRFEPKDFRMAGPDGQMKALPKNLRRVPYNLPKLLAAIEAGEVVYWVEGEKDVHSLAEKGVVATTSAGGGGTPPEPAWAALFEGAHLVVVGDKDKTGQKYAKNIAKLVVNEVASVRVAQAATPQAKSDVTDHLAAGYRLDQLDWQPMRSIRRTRWTMSDLMSTPPEPLRWALPGVIPEGLTLLVGAPKAGKSWFNLNLVTALTTGRPVEVFGWGQDLEPCPSLYLALEDPHRRVYDRMNQITRGLDFKAHRAGDVWLSLDPLHSGGRDEIERWLEKNPTARMIAVDVLAKVRDGDEGQTMYQADYEAVGALKDIADDYGIGVVVTHHDRKKTDDDFVNMVSGTKGVTGAADTILYLERKRGSDEGTLKSESRDVESCTYKMQFVREFGRWQILERLDPDAEPSPNAEPKMALADQISQVLMHRGESSLKDVAKVLDVPEATVKRAAADARENGALNQTSDGKWYVPKVN